MEELHPIALRLAAGHQVLQRSSSDPPFLLMPVSDAYWHRAAHHLALNSARAICEGRPRAARTLDRVQFSRLMLIVNPARPGQPWLTGAASPPRAGTQSRYENLVGSQDSPLGVGNSGRGGSIPSRMMYGVTKITSSRLCLKRKVPVNNLPSNGISPRTGTLVLFLAS